MSSTAKDVLKVYWHEARRYKRSLGALIVFIFVSTAVSIIVPLYYKKFFDVLSAGNVSPDILQKLIGFLFIILGIHGISWLSWRIVAFVNSYFQSRVITDLKQTAFDYLIEHSYGFFINNFSGSLVQKVNRLSRSFERFADRLSFDLYPLIIRTVGMIVILWIIQPLIGVIMLVWITVFVAVNFLLSLWKLKYDTARAAKDSEVTGALSDAIGNHNTIQLFTGFRFESLRFKKVIEELQKLMNFTWNLSGFIEAIQAILWITAEFFLFYFGVRFWSEGTLTIGTFVLIQSYLLLLFDNLWQFGRIIRDVYESFADAKEMVEILHRPHHIQDVPAAKPLVVTRGEIAFKNVHFSFRETRTVLENIDAVIKPGEKVALIGPSGAGKSTFVKLLFRFYEVGSGEILIDGQNIQRVTQESLRANVGLVPQDPVLFHRTLMENIRYGRREATDAEVQEAATLAHCDEFIKNLPYRYETLVGERGIKLSGGERQRVAIARAMLKNAPILVLDEATSSLDSHSENLIQDALEKLMRNKTTIVIAHRLSTIRKMDRIIVIDQGKIIEEGTHDELLTNPESLYQKLWKLQAGGFLKYRA